MLQLDVTESARLYDYAPVSDAFKYSYFQAKKCLKM